MINIQIPVGAASVTVNYIPLIGQGGVQYALTPDAEDVTDMIAYFKPLGFEIQEIVGSKFTRGEDGQWYESGFFVIFKRTAPAQLPAGARS